MAGENQFDLFSSIGDLRLVQILIADLHDDLQGKLQRFRYLTDLTGALGSSGTMLPGGETTFNAWAEARTSFIHGNYMATVFLCQVLAEQILAAYLALDVLNPIELPRKISFRDTLDISIDRKIITEADATDLRRLMELRNPLSHYRGIDDPANLSRRVLNSMQPAEYHLASDARFAISMAVRLLASPPFKLGEPINVQR
ncbi:MAG: hypothetical protein ACREHE_17375 [Rhizomicrobium sp.]